MSSEAEATEKCKAIFSKPGAKWQPEEVDYVLVQFSGVLFDPKMKPVILRRLYWIKSLNPLDVWNEFVEKKEYHAAVLEYDPKEARCGFAHFRKCLGYFCQNYGRAEWRYLGRREGLPDDFDLILDDKNVHDCGYLSELRDAIQECKGRLKDMYRAVFKLRIEEGLRMSEIQRRLKLRSEGVAKGLRDRMIQQLRACLVKKGFGNEK